MKNRPLQFFSDDYLSSTKTMSPTQIVKYLDEFRLLIGERKFDSPLKLVAIKIPEALLGQFRERCKREGVAYQSKIKTLMRNWLVNSPN